MATYPFDLIQKRARINTKDDGRPDTFTATITIPAGQIIAQNDVFQVTDLAYGHTVEAIRIFSDQLDDGTTIVWNIGYSQLNIGTTRFGGSANSAGLAQDYDVPTSTWFPSPATNATYFQSANTFGRTAGWSSVTMANTGIAGGVTGPVRIQLLETAATPTQTTSSAVARTIRVEMQIARATLVQTNNISIPGPGGYFGQ